MAAHDELNETKITPHDALSLPRVPEPADESDATAAAPSANGTSASDRCCSKSSASRNHKQCSSSPLYPWRPEGERIRAKVRWCAPGTLNNLRRAELVRFYGSYGKNKS